MIYTKTEEQLSIIRSNGDILGRCHAEVAKKIKEGITTKELDKVAFEYINDNKAIPSFLNYKVSGYKYPASLCISVNEVIVHGIPNNYVVKEGDILSIDCGVYKDGFHADSAYTYGLGNVAEEVKNLMKATKQSLFEGIEKAVVGKRIGDIGYSVQQYTERLGYSVVRELVGHGLGKSLHEDPEVANYGKRGEGAILKENMVLAIEPMINLGKRNIYQESDWWTIRTLDKKQSAHYEHTVAVKKDKAAILTTFFYIEEVLQNSSFLLNI